MDKDDYLLLGYITMWKVLERCRKNPDIINNFSAYLFRSIKNAYATEFRKYVFKNPIVLRDYDYGRVGYGYNIANTVMLTKYKERILQQHREWSRDFRRRNPELVRRREREYWHRNRDKKALKDKRYYIRHREQIREYGKKYRAEHKEEIREKKKKYAQEHREQRNAYQRRKWHENPEHFRAYHREYGRRYRQEHLEHCRARDREQSRRYRQEYPDKGGRQQAVIDESFKTRVGCLMKLLDDILQLFHIPLEPHVFPKHFKHVSSLFLLGYLGKPHPV
jgi:hypothetical protein